MTEAIYALKTYIYFKDVDLIVLDLGPNVRESYLHGYELGSEFLLDPKIGSIPVLFEAGEFEYSCNWIPIYNAKRRDRMLD